MTRKPPSNPLVAIIGATGTGKSQLAVEIAKRHNGEIINGDAMQLYSGLPIITNKITTEEQEGMPHYLLGCIGLQEPTWVVGTFVKKALGVIEEIRARGKLPILVGGTHYYTQSLLFHDRLAEEDDHSQDGDEETFPLLEEPTEVLLEELQKIDPVMAARWHPKDRRKIQRSLEIYLKTGRKASDIYAEQQVRKSQDSFNVSESMRFPTLLLWVHAETEPLRTRVDARVDKMLQAGLLDEVQTLNAHAARELEAGRAIDETRGIWVSIGYKEFKDYTAALQAGSAPPDELQKMKLEATERTQIATRQYAKRQIRWIRIKLFNSLHSAGCQDSLYLLDGSDASQYATTVVHPALDLTQRFLGAEPMPDPSSLSSIAAQMLTLKRDHDISSAPEKWTKQQCEVCNVTCVVHEQWDQHMRSKAHKKAVSKKRQRDAERPGVASAAADHDGPGILSTRGG